jgi:type I restriction enzyme S subunit
MSWPRVKLGGLEGAKGNFIDGPFGSNLKASEYVEEGVPIIQLKNIKPNKYLPVDVKFISDKKAKELSRHSYQAGDLVIAKLGAVGTACIIPQNCDGGIVVADVVRFRGDKSRIDYKYLCYFLNSDEGQRQVQSMSRGATRTRTNLRELRNVEIPLPSLATQKQIAEILEKADQLRKDCQKMEQELDNLAQSVFIDMFGDPVINTKGWRLSQLGSVLTIKHGYAFKSEFFREIGDYVLLTPGNFYEKGGYRDRGEKQKYYIGEIPKGYVLKEGDLLIAMTEQAEGLLGSSLLIPESNRFLHNQRLGLVELKDETLNRIFLSYLFNHKSVRLAIQSLATGIKVKHTSPTKIEAIEIGIPPMEAQRKFESIVSLINAQLTHSRNEKHRADTLFKSLMQKAFNGEFEVKECAQ